MDELFRLVSQFRKALDNAWENGEFFNDIRFRKFPSGCCDDTCDLLGKYLDEHGYPTQQVLSTYRDGAFEDITGHAWLLYKESTIIDITGDQFKRNAVFLNFDIPVYIGENTELHRLFDIDRICENCDVNSNTRLHYLYQIIKRYLL